MATLRLGMQSRQIAGLRGAASPLQACPTLNQSSTLAGRMHREEFTARGPPAKDGHVAGREAYQSTRGVDFFLSATVRR